jgi:hypothetical protein
MKTSLPNVNNGKPANSEFINRDAKQICQSDRGHSTRVGATQDLAALDIDLAAITQAGGWKSTRMPLQYAEKINDREIGNGEGGGAGG